MDITKSKIVQYKIRFSNNTHWANIALDIAENKKSGRISISSDFGSWSNYWTGSGNCFLDFLCQMKNDMYYFAGKINEDRYIDINETLSSWKGIILQNRRTERIDANRAKKLIDEIKVLESEATYSTFQLLINKSYELMNFFDGIPETHTTVSPNFKKFWEIIYVPFCDFLQQEKLLNAA
jgi:hypothetical protein